MQAHISSGKLLLDREEGATFHDWLGETRNVEIDGSKIVVKDSGTYLVIVNAKFLSDDINSEFTEENPQPAAGPCVELVITQHSTTGLTATKYITTLESHDGSVRSSVSWSNVLYINNDVIKVHVDTLSQLIKSLTIKAELIMIKLS